MTALRSDNLDARIVADTTRCQARDMTTGEVVRRGITLPVGCPPDCKCDVYCYLRSEAVLSLNHDDVIQDLAHKRATKGYLQFCGLGLWLNDDGTYSIEDTSGG